MKVRILPPPQAWIGTRRGPRKTPVFLRLARLEKRLDFRCATRDTTPQAPCTELHGRYRTPKELARNAKNPGKTRVLQRRGQDSNNLQIPWEKPGFQNEATRNPTRAATTSHALASHRLTNSPCSELLVLHRKMFRLAGLIARWSFLLENRSQRDRVLPIVGREN